MAVILPTPEELLKTITIKQLPQAKVMPTMYNKQFEATTYIDLALVILALRQDVQAVYEKLIEVNDAESNLEPVVQLLQQEVQELSNVQAIHTQQIASLDARVTALENPTP